MRAEVKVGLIVGVVAIAGAAIWWFSGSRKELDSLPIDKRAMDATAPGETALVGDVTPKPSDARRSGESSPGRPDRTSSTPAPARRTGPGVEPRGQTEPKLDQPPATARPGAEPGGQTSPSGRRVAREPAAKPTEPPTPGEKPGPAKAGRTATEAGRSRLTDAPPPAVEPPRRRETPALRHKPYTIERGDRLITIAQEEYGDRRLWRAIKAVNPDLDENRLKIGEVIKLPSLADAQRLLRAEAEYAAEGTVPRPTTPPRAGERSDTARATYVVEEGDTLIKIARNVLNDSTRWREIFELNRTQLDSADVIRPGMVLRLPPLEKE